MESYEGLQDAATNPDVERARLEAELNAAERRLKFLLDVHDHLEAERKAMKSRLYAHQLGFSVLGGYSLGTSFGQFYGGHDYWVASAFLLSGLAATTISGVIMWWRMKL